MSVAFTRPTFFIVVLTGKTPGSTGGGIGIFDKIRHNMTKVLLLKRSVFDKMERESGEPDCFNGFKA